MPEHEPSSEQQFGVIAHRVEHGEQIVTIRWRDGRESEMHFPAAGFPVHNAETRERLDFIKADDALKILRTHAAHYTREEFDWRNFLNE